MIVIKIKMSYRFGCLRERSRSPIRRNQTGANSFPTTFSPHKFHNDFSASDSAREISLPHPHDLPLEIPQTLTFELRNPQEVDYLATKLSEEEWKKPMNCPSPSQSTDCDDNLIWSGFLSRSKRHKVGVDIYLIKGHFELPSSVYHLDIPFRSPFPVSHRPLALLKLESSNNTQDDLFKTCIEYFSNKHRAGYIPLGKQGIYVIPYGNFAKSLCSDIGHNQMLGFVVDASVIEDVE
ncbi:unnamed protein product [Blepharisma stoltei]|uniref:Uncharacterized protein n=1 Tax=Blepharisma stoltei TaxID=1481888 RepID=A0AAU9J0D2_9CILI|nr:unnamed protein product [Blepharisma stoltei]